MLKLNLKVWGSNPQRRRSGDLLDMRGLSTVFSPIGQCTPRMLAGCIPWVRLGVWAAG